MPAEQAAPQLKAALAVPQTHSPVLEAGSEFSAAALPNPQENPAVPIPAAKSAEAGLENVLQRAEGFLGNLKEVAGKLAADQSRPTVSISSQLSKVRELSQEIDSQNSRPRGGRSGSALDEIELDPNLSLEELLADTAEADSPLAVNFTSAEPKKEADHESSSLNLVPENSEPQAPAPQEALSASNPAAGLIPQTGGEHAELEMRSAASVPIEEAGQLLEPGSAERLAPTPAIGEAPADQASLPQASTAAPQVQHIDDPFLEGIEEDSLKSLKNRLTDLPPSAVKDKKQPQQNPLSASSSAILETQTAELHEQKLSANPYLKDLIGSFHDALGSRESAAKPQKKSGEPELSSSQLPDYLSTKHVQIIDADPFAADAPDVDEMPVKPAARESKIAAPQPKASALDAAMAESFKEGAELPPEAQRMLQAGELRLKNAAQQLKNEALPKAEQKQAVVPEVKQEAVPVPAEIFQEVEAPAEAEVFASPEDEFFSAGAKPAPIPDYDDGSLDYDEEEAQFNAAEASYAMADFDAAPAVPTAQVNGQELIADGDPRLVQEAQRVMIERGSISDLMGKRCLTSDDFVPRLAENNPFYALIAKAGFDGIDLSVLINCGYAADFKARTLELAVKGPNMVAEDPKFARRVADKLSAASGEPWQVGVRLVKNEEGLSLNEEAKRLFAREQTAERSRIMSKPALVELCSLLNEDPGAVSVELLTDAAGKK